MAKKSTEVTLIGEGTQAPDFSGIIKSESISLVEKRKLVLEKLGLKGTKKKYATTEERKAAAKARSKERRDERASVLKKYGLAPQAKGPKKTKAQKKATRKARGKARRGFLREMAKANPELAATYGIDPKRFKL